MAWIISYMANDLQANDPRVGFCWDRGVDDYPAMLHDTGAEVRLVVSYFDSEVLRRRFLGRTVTWGDDPDYTRHEYRVPEVVWFADHLGHVCLVEPRRSGSTLGSSSRVDQGSTSFRFAVACGQQGRAYSRINGMRTHLQGLDEWIPLGAVSHERQKDAVENHRDVITLEAKPSVKVGRRLNASIENWYSFSISPHPGGSKISDRVHLRTEASSARTWDQHLDVHNALRQLLVVAGWQRYGFTDVEVQQKNDPETVMSGDAIGPRWAPVFTYALERPTEVSRSRFLFTFEEIGAVGVGRWFALRDRFGRGVAAMLHTVGRPGGALETTLSEAAAALEHIGHHIGVEAGENPGQRIREHLRRVTGQIRSDIGFDLDDWVLRLADAYRRVKHPDHDDPDSLEMLNLLREARLVFRVWVAGRLGATPSVIEGNLRFDAMRRPYERL